AVVGVGSGQAQFLGDWTSQAYPSDLAGHRAGVAHLVAEAGVVGVVDRGRAVLDRGAGRAGGLVDLERLAAAVAAAVVAVARVAGDRKSVVLGQAVGRGGGRLRAVGDD